MSLTGGEAAPTLLNSPCGSLLIQETLHLLTVCFWGSAAPLLFVDAAAALGHAHLDNQTFLHTFSSSLSFSLPPAEP